VSTDDIRAVALPVLRHRVVTNFNAEAEGIRSDTIVQKLLDFIPRQGDEGLDRSAARLLRETPAA
jgi:MoxR-like ATPase